LIYKKKKKKKNNNNLIRLHKIFGLNWNASLMLLCLEANFHIYVPTLSRKSS